MSDSDKRLAPGVFLQYLQQSNLLSEKDALRVPKAIQQKIDSGRIESAEQIAGALVRKQLLTRWQADKLLKGKHKSFRLGKYRLLGIVGKGGMSTVYLAEHMVMKRRCALKVLPNRRVADSSWLSRFRREAQVGASLDHPNIVRTYDIDSVMEGNVEVHFIVMEYVDGEDLARLVERTGPIEPITAVDYIRQSLLGLAHAHEAELVHRDIKPANLLLDEKGTIRLMDLGLVTAMEEDEESLTRAHDEKVIGTADYLSPEQALDSHLVDPRADLYSLGCTLYFLLTGRPPFHEGSLAKRILAHQTQQPDAIEDLVPNMPPGLAEIIRRMMEKKAEDRYPSAPALANVLSAWLQEHAPDDWHQESGGFPLRPLPEPPVPKPKTDDEEIPVARTVGGDLDFDFSGVDTDFAEANEHPAIEVAPSGVSTSSTGRSTIGRRRKRDRLIVGITLMVLAVVIVVLGVMSR